MIDVFQKIKKWLKRYFIPHEHNNHKPHILRIEATIIILSVILLSEVVFLVQFFLITPKSGFFAEILPAILVDLSNKERQQNQLVYLKLNPLLENVAQMKADDMAKNGYFSHNSPTGITPWQWFDKAGYDFSYAGENLAINFFDSSDVTRAWMNSPTHRANILNGNFTEIGIAAAKGIYQGKETIFIVQAFGKPRRVMTQSLSEKIALNNFKNNIQEKTIVPENSSSTEIASTSLIVAVRGESVVENIGTNESFNLPENGQAGSTVSFIKKAASMPHLLSNYLYLMLFTMIFLALVLKIFIKIKVQHPTLIINGATLLLVIASVVMINQNLTSFSGGVL